MSAQLEQMRKELLAENEMAAVEQRRATKLERTVTTREAELGELRSKCRDREDQLHELQREVQRGLETKRDAEQELESVRRDITQELESVRRDAKLDQYRALEAECAKWESRELQALEQLETTRRELEKGGGGGLGGAGVGSGMYADKLIIAERQLQVAANKLEKNRTVIVRLQTKKDTVCLEREGLRAACSR